MADRLKFQPGAKLMSWADFYAQNRGWITTVEVTRVQAEGNKPLAEEIAARIGKSVEPGRGHLSGRARSRCCHSKFRTETAQAN